jgi:hypothetical protein
MGKKSRAKKEARLRRQRNSEQIVNAIRAKIDPIRKRYAKNWSEGHASTFTADGHYQWMADFVKGRYLVLEIGAGDGAGTLALCANGSIVVSVDKNPFCLERAHQTIKNARVPVVYEPRGKLVAENEDSYEITFGKVNSAIPASGALLLGGDIMTDDELGKWLFANRGFDAIVCWNIGTFQLNTTLASSEAEYRLKVQNRIYETAEHLLKKGGILHIVDRASTLIEGKEAKMRAAMIEGHMDQASVTSLRVNQEIAIRPYTPPPEGTGIRMKAADTTEFEYDANKLAFWSITAEKP